MFVLCGKVLAYAGRITTRIAFRPRPSSAINTQCQWCAKARRKLMKTRSIRIDGVMMPGIDLNAHDAEGSDRRSQLTGMPMMDCLCVGSTSFDIFADVLVYVKERKGES